ncbi:MAG: ArnT family glycosyltransferase [Candidatus Binataceae bacterium]
MKSVPPQPVNFLQLGLLVILVAFLTTNRLDASAVCGGSEAIEAVFLQQMVEHGQWLFPLDNGRGPMYKPPLFHWTAAAIDRLAGIRKVTAFNLRLPAALYATAGAALTMGFALSRMGPEPALLSGLIIAASYEYISQGRIGRVDMTLTFFMALSLFSFLWWLEALEEPESSRARRRQTLLHYLLAASLGLGVLAKGPVGAILPGLAIGLLLVLKKRWLVLRRLLRPLPVVFGAVIASSWYGACLLGSRYNFLSRQIGSENLGRFFGTLGRMPLWYYAQPLLLNAGPISLLIPIAVVAALATHHWGGADWRHSGGAADRVLDSVRLFALFWVVTVVFFELAAYKRKAYLLPLWPPSAILLAWWTYRIALPRWGRSVVVALVTACVVMTVANFFFIPWREVSDCGGKLSTIEVLEWPAQSLYGTQPPYVVRQDWLPQAARKINSVVGTNQPLFTYRFDDALEPLVFYLDRNTLPVHGAMNLIPPGYVLVPVPVWNNEKDRAHGFKMLLTLPDDENGMVLLHHQAPAPASERSATGEANFPARRPIARGRKSSEPARLPLRGSV